MGNSSGTSCCNGECVSESLACEISLCTEDLTSVATAQESKGQVDSGRRAKDAITVGAAKIRSKFAELKSKYEIERDRNQGQYEHFDGAEKNGSTYVGFIKDGNKSGFGTYSYSDSKNKEWKSCYQGQWYQNKAHGLGIFSDSLGEYLGFWVDGKKQGVGFEKWTDDGTIFLGTYSCGLKEGRGMYAWKDGSTYEGQLRDNEITGEGKLVDDEGIYIGQFHNNVQQGMGRWQYANGNYYIGQFGQSQRHGEGTLRWTNEEKEYSGQWKKGLPSGQGTITVRGETRKAYYIDGKAVSKAEYDDRLLMPDATKIADL